MGPRQDTSAHFGCMVVADQLGRVRSTIPAPCPSPSQLLAMGRVLSKRYPQALCASGRPESGCRAVECIGWERASGATWRHPTRTTHSASMALAIWSVLMRSSLTTAWHSSDERAHGTSETPDGEAQGFSMQKVMGGLQATVDVPVPMAPLVALLNVAIRLFWGSVPRPSLTDFRGSVQRLVFVRVGRSVRRGAQERQLQQYRK